MNKNIFKCDLFDKSRESLEEKSWGFRQLRLKSIRVLDSAPMDIEIGLSGKEIRWESDIYRGFDISFLIVFLNFVSFFGFFIYFWEFY